MHSFICKAQEGSLVPLEQNKRKLLLKLLNSYEELNMKFKVTIEVIEKNINEQQISLYKSFIIKASNHFGNTFEEMELLLKRFHPTHQDEVHSYRKPIKRWNTRELNEFIIKASALLAEQGFKFE